MGKDNFVTMGQIYKTVIDRERRFEYEGEDVEAIPYITDEILSRIHSLARHKKADIVLIELGGTAGEYQNVFYYEASRMLALKKPNDVIHIHVSYVPTPGHLGEPKTKPTQLSIRTLNSMGIQPDFIITRGERYLDQRRRDRLALFCNMHKEDVISSPDLPSVYEIPLVLNKQELDKRIMQKLGLPVRKPNLREWTKFVESIKNAKKELEIAIVGKYFGTGEYQLKDSYAALFDALDHAAWKDGVKVRTRWVDAEKVELEGPGKTIGKPDGIIVPIGWGERGAEGMIEAASYARESKIPYLGLCYGMQLAAVSFARDVLGYKDANTEENNKSSKRHVIHFIPSQKKLVSKRVYGGTMRLGGWDAKIKRGSRAHEIYKKHNGFKNESNLLTSERHRHRYEFNDRFTKEFEQNGFVISARSVEENLAEIAELSKDTHPFFLGTQGHPEYKSRPLSPHPIFLEFIDSCKRSIE
jgi:CTP synthase